MKARILWLTIALASAVAIVVNPAAASDKAVLMTSGNFIPEYAFLLLGKDRGYLAAEGIDLEIQEGRSAGPTLQQLGQGNIDFAFADTGTMIKAVMAGAPIVSVGVLQKKSLSSVMGFAEKNIRTPKDLIGKRIMMTPGEATSQVFPAFLKLNGIAADQLEITAGDLQAKRVTLMTGNNDLVGGNFNDQGPTLEGFTGKPIYAIVFSDWGVNQVGSGIEVNKSLVAKNPDLIRRFMRAAAKSYIATRESPEAAADAMLKVAPLSSKRDIIIKGLNLGFPYHQIVPGKSPFYVSQDRIADTVKLLIDYSGTDPSALKRIDEFVDLRFIQ